MNQQVYYGERAKTGVEWLFQRIVYWTGDFSERRENESERGCFEGQWSSAQQACFKDIYNLKGTQGISHQGSPAKQKKGGSQHSNPQPCSL